VCSLEGATYKDSYGIATTGSALKLDFVTVNTIGAETGGMLKAPEAELAQTLTNVGSRVYLMDTTDKYMMFKLKNREFSFTADMSALPCGLNGALYFVEMAADGGLSAFPNDKAGAKFGTGYCDAQCPHDLKFINGEANTLDWVPSDTDANSGTGFYGTCCMELDIWEANSHSTAYTPHTCTTVGQVRCSGSECGDIDDSNPNSRYEGLCDKDGCDFNPYRFGITNFLGPGPQFSVNTLLPVTVVTQFYTTDGTDSGDLKEMKQFYIQNGKQIASPSVLIPSVATGKYTEFGSTTDDFCASERQYFNESHNGFKDHGGMKAMGNSMDRGHVLVMSLWDDHYAHMLWLDSTYPVDSTKEGDKRGPCSVDSGAPTDVEVNNANSTVIFSNIKFGPIGSTF